MIHGIGTQVPSIHDHIHSHWSRSCHSPIPYPPSLETSVLDKNTKDKKNPVRPGIATAQHPLNCIYYIYMHTHTNKLNVYCTVSKYMYTCITILHMYVNVYKMYWVRFSYSFCNIIIIIPLIHCKKNMEI